MISGTLPAVGGHTLYITLREKHVRYLLRSTVHVHSSGIQNASSILIILFLKQVLCHLACASPQSIENKPGNTLLSADGFVRLRNFRLSNVLAEKLGRIWKCFCGSTVRRSVATTEFLAVCSDSNATSVPIRYQIRFCVHHHTLLKSFGMGGEWVFAINPNIFPSDRFDLEHYRLMLREIREKVEEIPNCLEDVHWAANDWFASVDNVYASTLRVISGPFGRFRLEKIVGRFARAADPQNLPKVLMKMHDLQDEPRKFIGCRIS